MQERDETLPRVSDIIHFLYAEELNKISPDVLKEAAERGNRGHMLIEKCWDTLLDNPIINLFKDCLAMVRIGKSKKEKPVIEKQLNGKRFTGKPDFLIMPDLIDYKFIMDIKGMRAVTALQLLLYGELIYEITKKRPKNYYAFHFHGESGCIVYKIPDHAIKPLLKFALSLVDDHEAIKAGSLIKYDKMIEWERLQLEHDVFEVFYTSMLPMILTDRSKADEAVELYYELKRIKSYEQHLNRELKRYMEENNLPSIQTDTGYGAKIQISQYAIYDEVKKRKVDAAYKRALEQCKIGTESRKSIRRYKKSKEKLIN